MAFKKYGGILRKFFSNELSRETVVGISGLILGLSFACIIAKLPGTSSEWASWVQAVGSIFAIVGAFLVARYQAKNQIRQMLTAADQARVTEGELAYVVAKDAMIAVFVSNNYIVDFKSGSTFWFDLGRLHDVQVSLRSLYGRTIPSEVLEKVITIQRLVTYSLLAIQQRNNNGLPTYLTSDTRDKARARASLANDVIGEIELWLNRERSKLGLPPLTDVSDSFA
nr:hypothetical protein [Burkholderia gladioli]